MLAGIATARAFAFGLDPSGACVQCCAASPEGILVLTLVPQALPGGWGRTRCSMVIGWVEAFFRFVRCWAGGLLLQGLCSQPQASISPTVCSTSAQTQENQPSL